MNKNTSDEYAQEWYAICEDRAIAARNLRRENVIGFALSFALVTFTWWLLLQY